MNRSFCSLGLFEEAREVPIQGGLAGDFSGIPWRWISGIPWRWISGIPWRSFWR
jgi:hypothetical protein